jgi:hypothetical protein
MTPKKKNAPPVRVERGAGHQVIHTRNLLKAKAAVIGEGPKLFARMRAAASRSCSLATSM